MTALDDARDEVDAPAPSRAVTAFSAALLLSAAALSLLVVPQLTAPSVEPRLPWWSVVPLFAVADLPSVFLRVGRSAFQLSFGQVPLVIGMTLVDPSGFVLAAVVGSAVSLLVIMRLRGQKLVFNAALFAFEAAMACTVYATLSQGSDPASLRSLLAALATIVVTDQVTGLAVTAVISCTERSLDRGAVREVLTSGLLVAVSNTSLALLVVVLVVRQPSALVLLAVVLVVLVLAYRTYEQLHNAHASLERHHAVAESLARAQGTREVVDTVLRRACEVLEAERAELHLGGEVHVTAGVPTATDLWRRWVDGAGASLLAKSTKDPQQQGALRAAGAVEAIVAPVHAGESDGLLVVVDRLGSVSEFSVEDLRSVETLSHQASVALENGRLVDRLVVEAAERAHEALHDQLTGLPNRRAFMDELDAALRSGVPTGVLLLDLDHFKDVNDALGHAVGDEVLCIVGNRLRASFGAGAVIARLGGDEFAVVVSPASSPTVAAQAAAQVRAALAAPVRVRDVEITVEPSVGSACSPADGVGGAALLQRADAAMYRAKSEHTGYEPYAADLDDSSAERLALHTDLRRAVESGAVDVHFQPAVDPATGRVVGAEALARWHHPQRGFVSPEEFIPLAESTGLIAPLTWQVLTRALTELARLRAEGLLPCVAVNLSPRALLDAALPARVAAALRDAGLPPAALTLEITEGAVMADPERALAVLHHLHAVGVRLSIDDFGTGYSSLSYLKRLPVTELKIDRSFVTALLSDAADGAIVRSTIELAHALGLEVVAEGVEDAETLARLGRWGCEAAQGFHISRPLSRRHFEDWLRGHAARVTQEPVSHSRA